MRITRTAKPPRKLADVKLWHCTGCAVVHMSVKDMVLNFTREEFSAFSDAVVDIECTSWPVTEGRVLLDLDEHDSVFHANAVVH